MNSFAVAVDCGFPFSRGCEIVTRCSSSGFASARGDVSWWPAVTSLAVTSGGGWDSGTDCLSVKSLVDPFAHHHCPSPSAVLPSFSHKNSWTSRSMSRL